MSHRGWVVVIGIIWTAAACSSTSSGPEDTSAEPALPSTTPANVEPGDSSAGSTSSQVPSETTELEPDPTSTRPGRRRAGQYEMGVHKFTVVDETRSTDEVRDRDETVVVTGADTRTIPVRIAYPAAIAGDDTEPAGTGFPLVVYAHGVSSSGSGVPGYFQHMAEAGYVVVGPDFPETSRGARNSSDFVEQPADVSLVLDRLIERVSDPNDQIFELFDPERLAISGHSLGGLTAYALAFHDCCRDERFDVVLVYAAVYLFPEGELELSELPTLFVTGTIDESPGVELIPDFFEQMQGPAYLLTLIDEEHPAGLYGHPKYRRPTNEITVAFLDAYLRDDSAGLEAIEPIDGLYEWRSSR